MTGGGDVCDGAESGQAVNQTRRPALGHQIGGPLSAPVRTFAGMEPPPEALERKVCAVCGRVLDYVEGRGWAHTVVDQAGEDHPAVPVADTEVPVRGRCDFCLVDDPGWVVEVDPVTMRADLGPGSFGASSADAYWACCEVCADLISTGRWKQLRERAVALSPGVAGMSEHDHLETLKVFYGILRKHVRGAPRPVAERGCGR